MGPLRFGFIVMVVAACRSRGPVPFTAPSPQECPGSAVAIVTNESDQSVDVMASLNGRSEPMTLGEVLGSSRSEFQLPATASRVYTMTRVRGTTLPASDLTRIRYECR